MILENQKAQIPPKIRNDRKPTECYRALALETDF